MSSIGFDIGNENCYIAAVRSGGIEVLDNEYNLRCTPTYIAFTKRSREVGIAAKLKVVSNWENTLFGFKRILGKKCVDADVMNEQAYLPHFVTELPSGDLGIKVNYLNENVTFSVTQLMAMIVTKLKMITEEKVSSKVRDCVLCVPVYYTDSQRRAMLDAAKIANLNALKLMNESTAVALFYGFYKQDLSEEAPLNVTFIDLGNSAVTVTACAFTKEKLEILGCVWNSSIGGRDFDNVLVKYFIEDFKKRYGLDVMSNKKALVTLMLECESLKKQMSANSLELGIQIECFMDDIDVKGRMKRDDFESLSAQLLNRLEADFRKIFEETNLKVSDIHSVEIVGGSSRLPCVKNLIRKVFEQEPNATLNQDEAVARGCALQCALMSPSLKTREFIVQDIPSFITKLVWTNVPLEFEMVSPRDKLPVYKYVTFLTNAPFVLEAYNVNPRHTSVRYKIASFKIGNIPSTVVIGDTKIQVKVGLDIHGVFSITGAKMIVRGAVPLPCKENCEEKMETNGEKLVVMEPEDQSMESGPSVTYQLSVTADVPSLSDQKLNEFIGKEQQMVLRYMQVKEQADARNCLEEYIYDVRGKISYELNDYIVEKSKTELLEYLTNMETWLYDNEEQEAIKYVQRLEESKKRFDPIFKRYFEWGQRPLIVSQCFQTLEESSGDVNELVALAEENEYVAKIESLKKIWQDFKQFMEKSLEKFNNLEKYEDVPLTIEDLKETAAKFQDDFKKLYNEIKDALDAHDSEGLASGDGNPVDADKSSMEAKDI